MISVFADGSDFILFREVGENYKRRADFFADGSDFNFSEKSERMAKGELIFLADGSDFRLFRGVGENDKRL